MSDAYDPNKGALPRNVSWYRKHFTLDPSWAAADSLVWLTFDGVFRAADVYINGAFVMHHEEGYTTWHAYLHNASAPLVWGGGENVLAVYVDATQSELWCYEGEAGRLRGRVGDPGPRAFAPCRRRHLPARLARVRRPRLSRPLWPPHPLVRAARQHLVAAGRGRATDVDVCHDLS